MFSNGIFYFILYIFFSFFTVSIGTLKRGDSPKATNRYRDSKQDSNQRALSLDRESDLVEFTDFDNPNKRISFGDSKVIKNGRNQHTTSLEVTLFLRSLIRLYSSSNLLFYSCKSQFLNHYF